jgi:hypothetical protein
MDWKVLLASITGPVGQKLLLPNEYLLMENRILRRQIMGRVRLGAGEPETRAEIGKRLASRRSRGSRRS